MEEVWDLYDKHKNLVGKTHVRGNEIPADCYHLIINAWVRNSKGQYLVTRRSASRKSYPSLYECVGGSVLAGESSKHGAVRELVEEVGLVFDESQGKLVKSEVRDYVGEKRFADILDVWMFDYDGDVDISNATTDEVDFADWMSLDEIK